VAEAGVKSDNKDALMELKKAKAEAKRKALDSLGRYKFQMFGYHASVWVTLNRLDSTRDPNPFTALVTLARQMEKETDARGKV